MATTKLYGKGMLGIFTGAIDLDTDVFKAMLLGNGYSPDQDVHDYRDDVTAFEVTGTGYVAGGATLAGVSVTYDAATNEVRVLWNDQTWNPSTITARYAVVYKARGGAASADELLGYTDFGQDMSSNNGPFQLDFTTSVFKATVA